LAKRKNRLDAVTVSKSVEEYLSQRLKTKLLDKGFSQEIIDAVISNRAGANPLCNLADVLIRCNCLTKLTNSPNGSNLIRAGVRIGNILTQETNEAINQSLFVNDAESQLWQAYEKQFNSDEKGQLTTSAQYEHILDALKPLVPLLDNFFDKVMVNDPDPVKKKNRHALLAAINKHFQTIADFPKLQALLP
jgi:glycyl-tRNA synthetase beta chain